MKEISDTWPPPCLPRGTRTTIHETGITRLRRANMSDKVDTDRPLHRPPEHQSELVKTFEAEFTCAITLELPLDPVTAEDGHVYERSAIEAWIERPGVLKSPKFNTPMGPRLLPSTQTRNVIEQMVRSGVIKGPKADAWLKKTERLADKKLLKDTYAKADSGDADAMLSIGNWYFFGQHGLEKDLWAASVWYNGGALVEHPTCTALLGQCRWLETGVDKDKDTARWLFGIAATSGSELGCFFLAESFSSGPDVSPKNVRVATRWYRAMESATLRDADPDWKFARYKAADWLRKHAA